jgi:hypothetical protein
VLSSKRRNIVRTQESRESLVLFFHRHAGVGKFISLLPTVTSRKSRTFGPPDDR